MVEAAETDRAGWLIIARLARLKIKIHDKTCFVRIAFHLVHLFYARRAPSGVTKEFRITLQTEMLIAGCVGETAGRVNKPLVDGLLSYKSMSNP